MLVHRLISQESKLPVLLRVAGHTDPVPFLLTAEMFGGIPIEMAGGEISELIDRPVAELHVHDVPEIYLLVSVRPGDAMIDVALDREHIKLTSPAALIVPAGVHHRFVTKKAVRGSFCFGIFLGTSGRHLK